MNDDEQALVASPPAGLAELTRQLEAAQAQGPKAEGDVDGGLLSEMTPGSLLVGLVLSTIGIGLVRYGRVTLQWMFAIVGAILMVLPFFVSHTWVLLGSGVGVIAAVLLLKRFVSF